MDINSKDKNGNNLINNNSMIDDNVSKEKEQENTDDINIDPSLKDTLEDKKNKVNSVLGKDDALESSDNKIKPHDDKVNEKALNKETINNDDVKSKGNFARTIWITFMILAFTIVSVGVYSPLKSILLKNNNLENYLHTDSFTSFLVDIVDHINDTSLKGDQKNIYKYNNMQNIKYIIKDTETQQIASNLADLDRFDIGKESKNSPFYIHANIDESGKPTIITKSSDSFRENTFLDMLDYDRGGGDTDRLSNLDIHFFLAKEAESQNDLLMQNMKNYYLQKNLFLIFAIAGLGMLIFFIISFTVPYSIQKEASIVRLFNKLYFELKFLCWTLALLLNFGVISVVSYNAPYYVYYDIADIIYDANWYFYFVGIPITFTIYYLTYLSICYIKHIYHTGFVDGFIKNTIVGRLFFYIMSNIRQIITSLANTDVNDDHRTKLLTLLGLNFLIICFIGFLFPYSWIFAMIYTALLFKYIMGIIEKLRELNKASSKLSKGDFDFNISEDMGILTPFVENLNNIKEGFEIAVKREVKSQNMKTELITNVSHDLKTPLTSIITYIDLLKNEDINEEEQNKYINVLDKKSKRLKILIDDLFDISKATSGNIEMNFEKLDLVALLRQSLGEMQEKIDKSNLQMRVNLPDKGVICELDGRKTYRVFENIMNNIFKYSLENSRVYIDTEENEDRISFIFKNISAYEMNFDSTDILERFSRGDASRGTDGSGLGLAIAKSLTELQKGKLEIRIDGDLFKLIASFPKMKSES